MAIEKITVPYEILFRLAEDGSVAGCHRRDLEILRDNETGYVYPARELDPQPVEGEVMELVLGVIATAQAVTIDQQSAQIAEKTSALESVVGAAQDLTAQLDIAGQAIAQQNEMISALQNQLAEKESLLAAAQTQLADSAGEIIRLSKELALLAGEGSANAGAE